MGKKWRDELPFKYLTLRCRGKIKRLLRCYSNFYVKMVLMCSPETTFICCYYCSINWKSWSIKIEMVKMLPYYRVIMSLLKSLLVYSRFTIRGKCGIYQLDLPCTPGFLLPCTFLHYICPEQNLYKSNFLSSLHTFEVVIFGKLSSLRSLYITPCNKKEQKISKST